MDLKRLNYFAVVAREGSFHRAAARLNIAQPALSRQVRELEQDLDAQLLIRSTQGVRLSPAGEALLAEVDRLLPQVDLARERTKRAAQGQFGMLRIAFTQVAADSRSAIAAVAEARRAMPDVDFRLSIMRSEDQLKELEADRIDVGLLYRRGPLEAHLAHRDLRTDRYVLAVADDHRLAGRKSVRLRELRHEEFVFPPPAGWPVSYGEWMVACQRAGFAPNIVIEAQSEMMFLNIVAEGLAIGFANSSLGQRRPFEGVTYVELGDLDLPLHLAALWKRDRETAAVRRIVDLLAQGGGGA
jgi:DNA-binding transcriptional LysR family regulator